MLRVALVLSAVLLGPVEGAAQEQNTGEVIGRRDIPAAVRALVTCGTDPDVVTRHAFAGGYLFAWDCARNPANLLQALVFTERYDGTGARLLRFPLPRGEPVSRRGQDTTAEISNKRLFPLTGGSLYKEAHRRRAHAAAGVVPPDPRLPRPRRLGRRGAGRRDRNDAGPAAPVIFRRIRR